jgi:hypothetical protein
MPKQRIPGEGSMARYDWTKATRGRYAGRFKRGEHVVPIADDVWNTFPSAELINDALRVLASAAAKVSGKRAPSRRAKRAA